MCLRINELEKGNRKTGCDEWQKINQPNCSEPSCQNMIGIEFEEKY